MIRRPCPFYHGVSLQRGAVPSFADYPFNIPAIRDLDSLELHSQVTFFIGENGSGKSTLLEAIAVAAGFNAEGGSKNFMFSTRETHSALHKYLELDRGNGLNKPTDGFFLRAESLYNVATEIDKLGGLHRGYGGRSLHEQSHGESFFNVMSQRFHGHGIYILDEPEAALSPSRQMSCLTLIHSLLSRESQFIIATHSPILMAYPDALIYQFSETGIRRVNYEDTEQYIVTRNFLMRREKMLKILMEEEGENENCPDSP